MKITKRIAAMLIAVMLLGCMVSAAGAESTNIRTRDYITFGVYEQDNNLENGPEAIEWLVLDVQDGRALLISRYALESKPIHNTDEPATWETCDLRAWLNGEFVNTAFTDEERARIPAVTVEAHESSLVNDLGYPDSITPGNDTQDQVFVLSMQEVSVGNKYFNGHGPRICKATPYAIARGAWAYDGRYYEPTNQDILNGEWDSGAGACWWWLRSPGSVQGSFVAVTYQGTILLSNHVNHTKEVFAYDSTHTGHIAVRPAMWIELEP